MKTFSRTTISLTLVAVFSSALLSDCVMSADQAPAKTTLPVDTLSTAQFKAIAQEGFIYGLPLVMNYAIMNEYAVDSNSSQFKAPFNHIKNLSLRDR